MMRRIGMPQACFKDQVSSGPSSSDTFFSNPLKTIFNTITNGPDTSGDPTSISQGYADQATSTAVPNNIFSSTTPFSADTSAASGVGSPTQTSDPFATIAQTPPTGTTDPAFSTGTTPFQTFGNVGTSTGTGLSGISFGGSTAPSAPSGVSPIAGADPTQFGGGQQTPPQGNNPPPAPGGQQGSFLDNLFSGIGKSFTSNPLSFLGGAGMLYNAYQTNQAMKGIPSISQLAPGLKAQADQLNSQGQQLASYLTSGSLPPGLQASLDQATRAAKENIISNFASRGLPTDPSKNSALASELAAVDAQAVISTAQMGQSLMQTGIQETGLSSQLYTTLAGIDQSMQQRIQQSIAGFAAAMSPTKSGANTITLKTG